FSYSICDSTGLCDTGSVVVYLLPIFDMPKPDTFYILEDNALQASVLVNDQFPYQQLDTTSLQITSLPHHAMASVSFSAGKITYTPHVDYFGADSFVYRICDTTGYCGYAAVRIVIAPVNDAPRITHVNGTPHTWPSPISLSACTNSALTWCFRLTDPEGEPGAIIGLSAPSLPGALIVRLNDSCFSFQPPPGYSGTAALTLSVNDPYDTVSYPIYLTVHPDPVVDAGADTLVCPGFPFIAVNALSFSASAWLWSSQGSGVFLNPNQLISTYVPSNQDILQGFVVLRVIAWGLAPCLTRDTAFIRISFRNLPYIELGLDTILCVNYRISLDAGTGMAAYAWSTGGGARYELVDTSNLPYPGGPVSVTVTDVHGCVNDDQISITFVGCPGFAEHFKDSGLRMWPNPAGSSVWLASEGVVADKYVIRIADMSGNIHSEREFAGTGNPLYTELDVSALPSGIYLVQYVSKQKSQTLRLVVLH
ncbi:MAG: T9SS type A sorting domain-containing protein, partial [Bacteroidales bacterium]|nr:T9SS type A sorting domain-containing protein [Bacteroidales bacterium]